MTARLHGVAAGAGRARLAIDDVTSLAVLDAARTLFSEGGFEAMTIAAVAERAGVSRQVVYRRFPHPRLLLRDLVNRDVEDFIAALGAVAPERDDLPSLVEASVAVFVTFVLGHRREYLLLFGRAGRAEPEVAAILGDLRSRLADLYISTFGPAAVAAGIAWPSPATARLVAYAVMALCEGVVLAWLEEADPGMDEQAVVQLLSTMVIGALAR